MYSVQTDKSANRETLSPSCREHVAGRSRTNTENRLAEKKPTYRGLRSLRPEQSTSAVSFIPDRHTEYIHQAETTHVHGEHGQKPRP